jgi:hypothetical protein
MASSAGSNRCGPLVASPPLCDVILAANSGHELGHMGLDDFLTRRPGWERPVTERGIWAYYGAKLYKASRIINFAVGEWIMFGSLLASTGSHRLDLSGALLFGCFGMALLAVVFNAVVLGRLIIYL